MKLRQETRRRYDFQVSNKLTYAKDGIVVKGGLASFPKNVKDNEDEGYSKLFNSPDECIEWLKANLDDVEDKANKQLFNVKTVKSEASASDYELIKEFMTHSETFKPEEVLVYKSYLCHNFADRDQERFTKSVLDAFNKTIVGKSKIFGHDHYSMGFARYFKSELVKMSPEECIGMMKEHVGNKLSNSIRKAAEIDGGVYWLVPSFYMLKDDAEISRKIDAGIFFHESIGAHGLDRQPYKDDKGKTLWTDLVPGPDGEPEALEGSFVFVGAQPGAGVRKGFGMNDDAISFDEAVKPYKHESACRLLEPGQFTSFYRMKRKHEGKEYSVIIGNRSDGTSDDQAFRYPVDTWTIEDARKHCTEHKGIDFEPATGKGAETDGGSMKVKILNLEKEIELKEEDVNRLASEVDAEFQKVVTEKEALKSEKDAAEKKFNDMKAIVGEDYTAEKHAELKKKADISEKLFNDLVEDAIKYSILAGLTENKPEAIEKDRAMLKSLDVDGVKAQMDKFTKIVDEKFPRGHQIKTEEKSAPVAARNFVAPY